MATGEVDRDYRIKCHYICDRFVNEHCLNLVATRHQRHSLLKLPVAAPYRHRQQPMRTHPSENNAKPAIGHRLRHPKIRPAGNPVANCSAPWVLIFQRRSRPSPVNVNTPISCTCQEFSKFTAQSSNGNGSARKMAGSGLLSVSRNSAARRGLPRISSSGNWALLIRLRPAGE